MRKLPNGWKTLELDEIAFVQTGIAINGEPDRTNPIRLPYLRVANVQDGHIDLSEIKHITVSEHQVARYALQVGDVLMTEGGDFDKLGRGAVWKGQITPCLHQNHVFSVRPDQAQILSAFLAAYCESAAGKRYFLSCSKQTTNLASINSTQLKEMPIVVPPLPEQQRIIAVLEAWNRAIEQIGRLITAKRSYKASVISRTLFDMGGKRGFVRDIADVNPRNARVRPEQIISFVAMEDVSESGSLLRKSDRVRGNLGNGYTQFQDGDVLVAKITPCFENGKGALADGLTNGIGFGTTEFHVVRPHDPADADYLHQITLTRSFRIAGERQMTGSAGQKRVPSEFIEDFPIFIQGDSVRNKIGNLLASLDAEVAFLEDRAEGIRTQKSGLMQKLLTGEWRLDERFDAEALSPRALNVGGRS